jgi:glutamyl/glutaminyl-tRNA synthetase
LIQEALGFPRPGYAHLPLILGPDRAKLSKRHGATAIRELREEGYLPEAVVNFLALLGWNPGDERELFTLAELSEALDLAKVQRSAAIFNREKLDWLNGEYIRRTPIPALAKRLGGFLPGTVGDLSKFGHSYLEQVVAIAQSRLARLSDIRDYDYFFDHPQYPKDLLRWKAMTDQEVAAALRQAWKVIQELDVKDFEAEKLQARFFREIGAGDRGELLWPLRVCLTGQEKSPGPFEIMAVMGRERVLERLRRAFRLLKVKPPDGSSDES